MAIRTNLSYGCGFPLAGCIALAEAVSRETYEANSLSCRKPWEALGTSCTTERETTAVRQVRSYLLTPRISAE